jgi:hypothetical protein
MTTPAQPDTSATDPGAPATGEQTPEPNTAEQPKPLGKPNQQNPSPPAPKPADEPEPKKPATGEDGPDWKARAREWESRSKANKAELAKYEQQLAAMRKALGIDGDEEDLPDHIQRKLTEAEQAKAEAEAERDGIKAEVAYEKAVNSAAKDANADAEALLDSDSFREAVRSELDEDGFTDDDLKKAVAKVTKEFAKKPRFAKATAPARSGGEIPAGPPPAGTQRPRSLTEALGRAYGGGS